MQDENKIQINEKIYNSEIGIILRGGDIFSVILLLFDIMIATDSIDSLSLYDKDRLERICINFGVSLEQNEKDILLKVLKEIKPDREIDVVMKLGLVDEKREECIDKINSEIEKLRGNQNVK